MINNINDTVEKYLSQACYILGFDYDIGRFHANNGIILYGTVDNRVTFNVHYSDKDIRDNNEKIFEYSNAVMKCERMMYKEVGQ